MSNNNLDNDWLFLKDKSSMYEVYSPIDYAPSERYYINKKNTFCISANELENSLIFKKTKDYVISFNFFELKNKFLQYTNINRNEILSVYTIVNNIDISNYEYEQYDLIIKYIIYEIIDNFYPKNMKKNDYMRLYDVKNLFKKAIYYFLKAMYIIDDIGCSEDPTGSIRGILSLSNSFYMSFYDKIKVGNNIIYTFNYEAESYIKEMKTALLVDKRIADEWNIVKTLKEVVIKKVSKLGIFYTNGLNVVSEKNIKQYHNINFNKEDSIIENIQTIFYKLCESNKQSIINDYIFYIYDKKNTEEGLDEFKARQLKVEVESALYIIDRVQSLFFELDENFLQEMENHLNYVVSKINNNDYSHLVNINFVSKSSKIKYFLFCKSYISVLEKNKDWVDTKFILLGLTYSFIKEYTNIPIQSLVDIVGIDIKVNSFNYALRKAQEEIKGG